MSSTVRSASFLIAALGVGLFLLSAAPTLAWVVSIEGTTGSEDVALAVALDSEGYILAAGLIDNFPNDRDQLAVVKVSPGEGKEIWRVEAGTGTGPERANAVAVDLQDNVIAAGSLAGPGGYYDREFSVLKLRGADGQELWRYTTTGTDPASDDVAGRLAVNAAGDVIAVGILENAGSVREILAVKLSGVDGAELWRQTLSGTFGAHPRVGGLGLDAAGDVFVAGQVTNVDTAGDFLVAKLSGADGSILWRRELDGQSTGSVCSEGLGCIQGSPDSARALAVHPSGDVIVGGEIGSLDASRLAVVRLAGADGIEQWRNQLCCRGYWGRINAIALDRSGDLVVAGDRDRGPYSTTDLMVAKLQGDTGSLHWIHEIDGRAQGYGDSAQAVAFDAAGDVYAAGHVEHSRDKADWYVVKLCGDGECDDGGAGILWEASFDGNGGGEEDWDGAYGLAIDTEGDPVTVGGLWNRNLIEGVEPEDAFDFSIIKLMGASGASFFGPEPWRPNCRDGLDNDGDGLVDHPADPGCSGTDDLFEQPTLSAQDRCTGRKLSARDHYARPRKRAVTVSSTDPAIRAPTPNGSGDPRREGAVLEIRNSTTGETVYFSLPALGWRALGNPAGSAGYKYRAAPSTGGPCRSLRLRSGRLKASCKGYGIGFTLDEPAQGALAARLHFSDGRRICMEFGGQVTRDESTATGGSGRFEAYNAPAPATCDDP